MAADNEQEKQYLHFINSPFTFEHQGVKVVCNDKGIITFTKLVEGSKDEFDEIEMPASVISRTMKFLTNTRKRVYKNVPYKDED